MSEVNLNVGEALEIIRALADGADPQTGEVMPDDSPYQKPRIVRALYAAIDALEYAAKRNQRKRNLPERAGKPWDAEESDLLVKRFTEGVPVSEIASQHKRTTGAIFSQLIKLGKIPRMASH